MVLCPVCGEQNPARARFCMACTAPLSTPEAREVRRTVTIVFSDLKGSTVMGEALDPESVREIMDRYFDRMRRALESHGGVVEKFIGDAVMAVFGLPRLHEDDALRAVRAAMDMRRELTELNEELDRRWGVRLSNRTGVFTGEVVAGDPAAGQRLVTGDAVNTAARLEQAAPADEVLIGKATHRLVKASVRVEPVEPLTVKGKSKPIEAFRLIEVLTGGGVLPGPGLVDTPLVGRVEELALLDETLGQVVARSVPRLALVIGDPGVGKTRVLEAFTKEADGARILRGRCPAYGDGITFWPLAEAVRGAAGIGDADDLVAARAKLTALVSGSQDAESIVERLGGAIGISDESMPVDEIFWATRLLLEHLAHTGQVIVVFDDLHWAEDTFLGLVEQLADSIQDAPVLLVGSARRDLLEEHAGWGRRAVQVVLEPLGPEGADRLIEARLGTSDLPAELRARIRDASGGNPLFVEQIVSMLVDEGFLGQRDGTWTVAKDPAEIEMPPTISALLAARLDSLSGEERSVIERASVPGQVFLRPALLELTPDDAQPRLDAILASLTAKHLVKPDDEGRDREAFRFSHVLIRDAAYAGMLKKVRADLHERFGRWLESTASERLHEYEELLGYHYEQAYRYRVELAPPDQRALDLGRTAAGLLASSGYRAMARGDVGAATNLLSRATTLVGADEPRRLEWLIELGGAQREQGQLASAAATLDAAIEEARSRGSVSLGCRATVERFECDMKVLTPGWEDRALEEAERMIPLLEELGDHRGLAKVWRMVSWVHGSRGAYGEWDVASWRSIEHARQAGDRREEIEVMAGLAINAAVGMVPGTEGVRRCQEILEEVTGNLRAEGFVRMHMAMLLGLMGRFDEARTTAGEAVSIIESIGGGVHRGGAGRVQATVERWAGDPAEAERRVRATLGWLEARGAHKPAVYLTEELARDAYEQGRYDEALALIEGAAFGSDPIDDGMGKGVYAAALARVGRIEEAVAEAREAVAVCQDTEDAIARLVTLSDLADVLTTADRPDEAVTTWEEVLRLSDLKEEAVFGARARTALASLAPSARRS